MITQYTSAKEIVARLIGKTGAKLPGGYADLILEWIPEAIEALETVYQLKKKSTPSFSEQEAIYTKNHAHCLPPDVHEIIAIEDQNGRRVPEGSDITDITKPTTRQQGDVNGARTTNFQKDSDATVGFDPYTSPPGSQTPWDGSDIVPVTVDQITRAYYQIEMGYIKTSLEEMFVKIHYWARPINCDGYPMVPDNEHYKQAIYWYVLGELIGAGYEHPVWKGPSGYQYCMDRYEKFAGRALGEIKYPTPDGADKIVKGFSERLIPPTHFHEDFFINAERRQSIYGV